MNWNSQSRDCFACLTLITDHLLVQPLTNITEGTQILLYLYAWGVE